MRSNTSMTAIRRQDPVFGIASADMGGALMLGAARDLCRKTILITILQLSPVLSCSSRWYYR